MKGEQDTTQGRFKLENAMFVWLQDPGEALAPLSSPAARQRVDRVFGSDFDNNLLPSVLNLLPPEHSLAIRLYFSGLDEVLIHENVEGGKQGVTQALTALADLLLSTSSETRVHMDDYEYDTTALVDSEKPIAAYRVSSVINATNKHLQPHNKYKPTASGVNELLANFSSWLSDQEPATQARYCGYRAFLANYFLEGTDTNSQAQYWSNRYPALPVRERLHNSGEMRTVIDILPILREIAHALNHYHTSQNGEIEQDIPKNDTKLIKGLFHVVSRSELDWQDLALCAQIDSELFFPEKGCSTTEAKKVCFSCDARDDCRDYAVANDERFGVWGGLSERERRRMKKTTV